MIYATMLMVSASHPATDPNSIALHHAVYVGDRMLRTGHTALPADGRLVPFDCGSATASFGTAASPENGYRRTVAFFLAMTALLTTAFGYQRIAWRTTGAEGASGIVHIATSIVLAVASLFILST